MKDNPMKDNLEDDPNTDLTPKQPSESLPKLKPQNLMDMILLDARAYTIKYKAAMKREENDAKQKNQNQLNHTVRLLEIDNGINKEYTDELTDKINTLKNNIQIKRDNDEMESTCKHMAKCNLEAETPTKSFCNQVKKSRKKVKLQCLLQKRKLTPEEQIANPNQKQYVETFCQNKIKAQVREFYGKLHNHKPTNPDKEQILKEIGAENIKTFTPKELEKTLKNISMA